MKKYNNPDYIYLEAEDESVLNNAELLSSIFIKSHGYKEAVFVNTDNKYFLKIELSISLDGDSIIGVFPISQESALKWLIKMHLEGIEIVKDDKEADKE